LEIYAPVATWASIQLILTMATIKRWPIGQLAFVIAYLQAPVETEIFMEVSRGFETDQSKSPVALKFLNNLYRHKQAGRMWFKYLENGLTSKLWFRRCAHYLCVFWLGRSLLVIYTDDTSITVPDPRELNKIISNLDNKFNITHQPTVMNLPWSQGCNP
jgi:hypothetical protein